LAWEEEGWLEILPETVRDFLGEEEEIPPFSISENKEYKVIWDGEEYICHP
jgi:hypothetical protein